MNDPAYGVASDLLVDVTPAYGHLPCFHDLRPLLVKTNAHTYITTSAAPDPMDATWLALALEGMEKLCQGRRPCIRDVAVIGTGGGLDAIGISHIFGPERLIASDIHPRALDAARWNIERYACRKTRYQVLRSDLFRDFPEGCRFDLVYENLPNVPDGTDLLDGIRAASCYSPEAYSSDPIADRYLLTLHHGCLVEAREHLRPGGWIVSMIGGRVPWSVIDGVFARAGFSATVLHFGLKRQTEPRVVLGGYARAEQDGSPPFTFYYPMETCRAIAAEFARLSEPASSPGAEDLPGPVDPRVEFLQTRLERCRVSAVEALRLHLEGEEVCHSVYVVGGTPLPGPGPRA